VTSTETKHANKRFLSQLAGFFPCFFLWVGWVVSFGGFDYRFLLVVGGAGNKLGSTLLTLILTPLKHKTHIAIEQLSALRTGLGTAAETRIGVSKNTCEIDDENQIKE
jgi:hypothetical protein